MVKTGIRRALAVLLVAGTVIALPAQAGHPGRGYGHWNGHNNYSHHNGGRHWGHRGYNNYGYNYGGGHRYYSHGHHNGDEGLYLAGGLILGSVLTSAYYNNYYAPRTVVQPVYREVVYESSPIVRSTRVIRESQARRLFRDRNGDCFERTTSASGEELLVELDRSACAW